MSRLQSSDARTALLSASGRPKQPDGALRSAVSPWAFVVILLLLAWGLRLCCLETVPPGWRDDELINIHALSGELFEGRFPVYFTGASGHEPLYHYLLAGVHAVLGFNVLSAHLLSVFFGVLTVALTYTLTRRLFGRGAAMIASLALATSFWSLMYSRTAIRHINLPPCALAAFYLLWRSLTDGPRRGRAVLLGLAVGLCLYIYPAARLLPVHLVLILAYLALFHRRQFKRHWRGFLLALAVAALLAMPLWVAIGRGRSEAAVEGIGADARLDELAVPLRELRAGNPRPFLESVWTTLGMFHATGDSEWLYNIAGRPVFNLLGAALFWSGVLFCLYRWRRLRCFFLLSWLGLGLLPAFVSTPPASLSHTILAQPVAYILPALALTEAYRWLNRRISSLSGRGGRGPQTVRRTSVPPGQVQEPPGQVQDLPLPLSTVEGAVSAPLQKQVDHRSASASASASTSPRAAAVWVAVRGLLVLLFLFTTAARDLRDYFTVWPHRGMVGFLYRADYRLSARYLNAHPEVTDVAVSSNLLGPWDRLALEVDVRRDDVVPRLFNPERALVYPAGDASRLILTLAPEADPVVQAAIERDTRPLFDAPEPLRVFAFAEQDARWPERSHNWGVPDVPYSFANGLSLIGWGWPEEAPEPGRTVPLLLVWEVSRSLDLPPMPIVANPPPPGVYSGPRLAVFAHLLAADADVDRASGAFLAGDDGLWVDPLTLRTGDRFFQIHLFALPADAPPAPYTLEVGLYDPMTGDRWPSDVLIDLTHVWRQDQRPLHASRHTHQAYPEEERWVD